MGLFDLTDSLVSPAIPVTVNGVEISRADIAREIQNHPANIADVALESATRALAAWGPGQEPRQSRSRVVPQRALVPAAR